MQRVIKTGWSGLMVFWGAPQEGGHQSMGFELMAGASYVYIVCSFSPNVVCLPGPRCRSSSSPEPNVAPRPQRPCWTDFAALKVRRSCYYSSRWTQIEGRAISPPSQTSRMSYAIASRHDGGELDEVRSSERACTFHLGPRCHLGVTEYGVTGWPRLQLPIQIT